MTHTIRYNGRQHETADSYAQALDRVRTAMLPQTEPPVAVHCEDGVYVYRSQEDADADDTGTLAVAVISTPDQDEE